MRSSSLDNGLENLSVSTTFVGKAESCVSRSSANSDLFSRHRAYPIVQKETGTASVFTCKYHGWSYRLDGQLTKAPQFGSQATPGFDKTEMGLFPVHIHVDRNGFLYVNLDAASTPEIAWDDQFGSMDLEPRFAQPAIDWENIDYDHTWTQDGDYNWKLMQENYNEVKLLP